MPDTCTRGGGQRGRVGWIMGLKSVNLYLINSSSYLLPPFSQVILICSQYTLFLEYSTQVIVGLEYIQLWWFTCMCFCMYYHSVTTIEGYWRICLESSDRAHTVFRQMEYLVEESWVRVGGWSGHVHPHTHTESDATTHLRTKCTEARLNISITAPLFLPQNIMSLVLR